MDDTVHRLLRTAELFARATGRSITTVSRLATGSGLTVRRLAEGKGITTHRSARVLQWFSDHWPEDLAWPIDIPRPAPSPDSPAAQPPEPVADPLATTLQEIELFHQASAAGDPQAAALHDRRMWAAALTLRADGRIASVEALCKAVGVERTTYDDVVRRYADGRGGRQPRSLNSDTARTLRRLVQSGDVRFASRRLPAAS